MTSAAAEQGAALTSATVQTGDAYGVTCTESGGAWFCPVPLAQTGVGVRFSKDGFANHTSQSFAADRVAATDAQGTLALTNIPYALKINITNVADLTGVTWEKKVDGGSYASVTPNATSGTTAYFAQTASEVNLVYRAIKGTDSGDTGATFNVSSAAQVVESVTLAACASDCPFISRSVTASNLSAGANTTYNITFQSPTTWPADGKFQATFPADYQVGGAAATLVGADGTVSVTVNGQSVLVTRADNGAVVAAQGTISVNLAGIKNPPYSGPTGAFGLLLENAAGLDLATGSASALTLTTNVLSSLSTSPVSTTAGQQTNYTFGYRAANDWAANGKLVITFPDGYALGAVAATLAGADGTATASVSGQTVTVTRSNNGATTPAGTAITVTLTLVTNPPNSGSSGAFALTLQNGTAVNLDTGSAPAITLTNGGLTSLTTSSDDLAAGATANYTFGFTITNPLPNDGMVSVTFPAAYTYGTPTATATGLDGSWSVSVNGDVLTLIRDRSGTATAASTAITLTFTAITNPQSEGSSGVFTIATTTALAATIDSGTAPAVTLASGALSISNLASATHPSGVWKSTSTFTATWSAPSDATVSCYSWAFDAAPDTTCDGTSTTATVSGLADGTHTFYLAAKNAAGSWGPIETYDSVSVDRSAPSAPTISSSHAASVCVSSSVATFSWGASDAHSGFDPATPFRYSLDGGALTATTTSSHTTGSLADGSHTFAVTAYDRAGNSATTTHSFKVDTTAPTTTLSSAAYTNVAAMMLPWTATDGCGSISSVAFQARYNRGIWDEGGSSSGGSGTFAYTALYGDGPYEFRMRAVDNAGNTGSYPTDGQTTTILDRVMPGVPGNVQTEPAQNKIRVSWDAATDPGGSGIAGYNVYITGQKANAQLITGLEYLAGPFTHGQVVQFMVKAVDRAGNEGLGGAPSGMVTVDAEGPQSAPTGFTVDQLSEDGSLRVAHVFLLWDPVDGAADYVVYKGPVENFELSAATDEWQTDFDDVNVDDPHEGEHHYAVVARDTVGNKGPQAYLSFVLDSRPPTSDASSPAESGPAFQVTWSASDSGAGVAQVQLWSMYQGSEPDLFRTTNQSTGATSFYGPAGRTYYFFAVATDRVGHVEQKTFSAQTADSQTHITSGSVQANENVTDGLGGTNGGGSGGGCTAGKVCTTGLDVGGGTQTDGGSNGGGTGTGGNIGTNLGGGNSGGSGTSGTQSNEPVRAEDRDNDGMPETFVDPSGRYSSDHLITTADGSTSFVITRSGDGQDILGLWDPAANALTPIQKVTPKGTPVLSKLDKGRLGSTFVVDEKSGWIYMPVEDLAPDREIENVLRNDGFVVPVGYYWRVDGYVVVMDDPSFEYQIVYGALAPAWYTNGGVWFAVILGLAMAGFVAWVEWPTVGRLRVKARAKPHFVWLLRHCHACRDPLPRLHRIPRWLHHCAGKPVPRSFASRLMGRLLASHNPVPVAALATTSGAAVLAAADAAETLEGSTASKRPKTLRAALKNARTADAKGGSGSWRGRRTHQTLSQRLQRR